MSSEESDNSNKTEKKYPEKKQKAEWRKQAFRDEWMKISPFKHWVARVEENKFHAKCFRCNKVLKAGKSELLKHNGTESHKKVMRSIAFSSNLKGFIKPKEEETEREAEIRMSLIAAEHNLSFHSLQNIVETFKSIFKDSKLSNKIRLRRTKCTNIINNVVAPALIEEVDSKIRDDFFSVLVDESTDLSNNKNLCVLVKYKNKHKLETQLLDLIQLSDSSNAITLYSEFLKCLGKHNLSVSNIVGYCSDNANVMMGKHESFVSYLLKDNPHIFVLGCICHSSHLIASHAADELPKNIENLLHSIYCYHSRSPKRQSLLEKIQENMNKEKHKMVNPSGTRWLALLNSVNRVLEQWEILQQEFLLAYVEDKNLQGKTILDELNNPYTKAYLEFMQYILPNFNTFNLLFQSDRNLIGSLYEECMRFLRLLGCNFIKTPYISKINRSMIFKEDCLLPLEKINIGMSAENTLSNLDNREDYLHFKKRCLKFYQVAMEQCLQRLPLI